MYYIGCIDSIWNFSFDNNFTKGRILEMKKWLKQIISVVLSVYICLVFVQVAGAATGGFDYVDEDTNIRFHADEGVLPEDVKVSIRQIIPGVRDDEDSEFEEILEDLDKDIRKQVEKLEAYIVDLSDKDLNPIQPDGYITVMIPVREDFDEEDLEILRVVQGDDVVFETELKVIEGQKYCVFKTNHFSTYCLIDKVGKGDVVNKYLPYFVYILALTSLVCVFVATRRPTA